MNGHAVAWLVEIDILMHAGSPSVPYRLPMAALGLANRRRLFHVQ
jgi:hypothetical protein